MSKWEFFELSKLCDLEKGKTGLMKAKEGEYPLVATGKDRRTSDTYQFDTKAVCIPLVSSTGHGHASLKYVHYQEGKFALGTILVAVIPKDENSLNAQFLHLYLSRLKDILLVPLMTGAANVTLTVTKLKTVKVPLLPIEEQLRIVSLFNCMDNKQAELTSEITYQQTLLKKLRQSILQEAIEGKFSASLREENPDIESASVLLEKIKQEKEQLVIEKKIKKQKHLPPISEDEMIFPEHKYLRWCRLSDLFVIEKGNTGIKKAVEGKYPLVVTAEERLSHNEYQIDGEAIIIPLVSSTGHGHASLNRIHYQKGKFAVGTILATLTPINNNLISTKLYYTYLSLYKDELLVKKMTGAANVTLTVKSLSEVIIPYVPLLIQKRIEYILDLIENFEIQTKQSEQLLQIFMQVVLKEAFE